MSRFETTIILITDSLIMRADFEGRNAPRIASFVHEERPAGSTSADVLESLVSRQRTTGRRTLVLDTSIWNQVVSVPRLSVLDVDPGELENALKFEVETLSGIEADHSILGTSHLENNGRSEQDESYWVNVAERSSVDSAIKQLRAKGAKWVGFAHPAGCCPQANTSPSNLIELWDNLAYLFADGTIKSIASRSGHWHEQFGFDSWDAAGKTSEWVAPSAAALPGSFESQNVTLLDDEEVARQFLTGIARRMVNREMSALPVIVESQEPDGMLRPGLLRRIALALAVTIFCFVHYSFLKMRKANIESQIIQVKQPAVLKRNYDTQLAGILETRREMEEDADRLLIQVKRIEFLFKYQTGRLEQFLDLLLGSRTTDLVIEEIAPHEKGILVKGVSLGGNSAPLMANRLRELAIPLGWRIHAPTQIGEQKMVSGGPWQFSILFEDVGPKQAPATVNPGGLNRDVALDKGGM